jgi:hypothetical protein
MTSHLAMLADDLMRHLTDIRELSYEGVGWERDRKEEAFRVGFDFATPVAEQSLQALSEQLLGGTGTVCTVPPESDGRGGLVGRWELTWPELEKTHDRTTGEPFPPVRVAVVFPTTLAHPHLAILRPEPVEEPRGVIPEVGPDVVWAWPFQVTSPEDAIHMEPLFWVVALGEIHERTARSAAGPYQVLPPFAQPSAWGRSPVGETESGDAAATPAGKEPAVRP